MNTSVTTTSAQFTQPAVVVQREQQAPHQAHDRAASRPVRAGPHDESRSARSRSTRSPISTPDVRRRSRASSRRASAARASTSARSSLGDSYRPNDDLQIQYGVRLDGNRFTSEPALNPAVEQLFGVANDDVPNRILSEPARRLLVDVRHGAAGRGRSTARCAVRARWCAAASACSRARRARRRSARRWTTPAWPSAVQQLACVGAAAPTPDWAAYAANAGAIPTQCADGTAGTVFSSTAPNVTLFDNELRRRRAALRSNLQWSGADARQPVRRHGRRDVLAEPESGEHVRSELQSDRSSSRWPTRATGRCSRSRRASCRRRARSRRAKRGVSPAFSHVSELRSDMKSDSQAAHVQSLADDVQLAASRGARRTCTSNTREQYRGFTSTAGNPLDVAWGRSRLRLAPQIQYTPHATTRSTACASSWFGSVPLGHAVHADRRRRHQRRRLLERSRVHLRSGGDDADSARRRAECARCSRTARGSARDCLAQQLGQLAARNSCQGPWTSTANLTFSFNPVKVRMPQRATLSVPALQSARRRGHAAARREQPARLGTDRRFRRTSCCSSAASTRRRNRYRYEVNQRFGATALVAERASARRSR